MRNGYHGSVLFRLAAVLLAPALLSLAYLGQATAVAGLLFAALVVDTIASGKGWPSREATRRPLRRFARWATAASAPVVLYWLQPSISLVVPWVYWGAVVALATPAALSFIKFGVPFGHQTVVGRACLWTWLAGVVGMLGWRLELALGLGALALTWLAIEERIITALSQKPAGAEVSLLTTVRLSLDRPIDRR